MDSLDKLGISYEEAREMVEQDMIVQRVQWLRVTSKVLQKVNSQEIKKAYQRHTKENPAKEEWKYQFITIRSDKEETSQEIALKLVELKEKAVENLTVAADMYKEQLPPDSTVALSVSQEFNLEDTALSDAHRSVLAQLEKGAWSAPTAQLSRDGTTVVRIFHLKDHTKSKPRAFAALANELKQNLLNNVFDQENKIYVAKLHKRFGFDENSLDIPPHFEPFTAK
jgi:hypothetical protein